nr:MAG TPA: hypothetical protein [Caudoviricetes sp.]
MYASIKRNYLKAFKNQYSYLKFSCKFINFSTFYC